MGYFDRFNNKGIPFMDNRDKGSLKDVCGDVVHIDDFGFIAGDDGDYAVLALLEHPTEFYFANAVITDMLKQVEADNMKAELPKQPIKFEMTVSKKDREYMRFEFLTDDIPF